MLSMAVTGRDSSGHQTPAAASPLPLGLDTHPNASSSILIASPAMVADIEIID